MWNCTVFIPFWQQSLTQDIDQFCLTSNTASPWFLRCPSPSSLPLGFTLWLSLNICYYLLSVLLIFLFSPKEHKLKQKEWRKSDKWRKPQSFLICTRQSERGPEPPFPSADFRQFRPTPAITYILTPILTTDSTPNYHLPSMTILQAHPQLQQCGYLKTRQRPTTTTSATFRIL